ncbi:aminoacyl tRNA synthase complex-interacting multifunctional protein 1-like [Xiphias gladius]|uniref:aminoacyl tRNA synthase complex-interacting multifunctional protein 1-like n=1 Tax=Xiphias gladius TaxID=8245 RepID=UPI001A986490|nr:aminoacyl tRNA synthase complex-interacting multifunctional protein 1-like [Xiphias gladius]
MADLTCRKPFTLAHARLTSTVDSPCGDKEDRSQCKLQALNTSETMGRSEELSDFQRGTVVGCHLCKKTVREISALLNLPRSTVSCVILKWKRGGITTALPRSGRPHKLKEEDRQVLERVALETCLSSVEALTTEFQAASGANVSSKTVRRELYEMGFRGRVSAYNKPKGGEKVKKKQAPHSQEDAKVDVSHLDLRVGRIITALQLPETDSLYVEQVDVGEASPRTVVSELAKHISVDQMQNRMAVLLCNLKPVEMRGVVSQAMVMCASSPDKVEILDPPSEAVPGDRVTFQGFPGEPDKELNPKTRLWEQIQPDLRTDGQCVATYKGAAFEVVGKGVCKSQTMSNSEIK